MKIGLNTFVLSSSLFFINVGCEGVLEMDGEGKNSTHVDKNGDRIDKNGDRIDKNGDRIDKNGDRIDKNGDRIGKDGLLGADDESACTDEAHLKLRRITTSEYRASVKALLNVDVPEVGRFQRDELTAGFAANWVSPIGLQNLLDYEGVALIVAKRALKKNPDLLQSCSAEGTKGDPACVEERLLDFMTRAYHRPPSQEEKELYTTFHTDSTNDYGASDADFMLVSAVLSNAQFLYVVPPYEGTQATSYATRLAFFLTGGPPDDELRLAATNGQLTNSDQLEMQIDRLLTGEQSDQALRDIFLEWLELDRLRDNGKNRQLFPDFGSTLKSNMLQESSRFIEAIVKEGGGVEELLTSRKTWVTTALAKVYGIAEQAPEKGFQEVTLPEGERAGLLTQASFLAAQSHRDKTSWVFRGDFIRRKLLCDGVPPPPADVDQSVINDNARLEDPVCSGCHQLMDPIGKAFDVYDAIGAYQTETTEGVAIASQGQLNQGSYPMSITGDFESPVALTTLLASSKEVKDCMTLNFFRFAQRRFEEKTEACQIADIGAEYVQADGDLKVLMKAIALSPGFRAL